MVNLHNYNIVYMKDSAFMLYQWRSGQFFHIETSLSQSLLFQKIL